MKHQKQRLKNPGKDLKNVWLEEMQEILGPSPVKEKDVEQRISEHIQKCFLFVDGFWTKSMFFLLDNARLKYLFVSASTSAVLGYDKEEIIRKGFGWLFTLFSEAELAYKKNVMQDVYGFCKSLRIEELLACTVMYDMVVSRKDGAKVHLLEEMMFPEVSAGGEPLITSCFLHNIAGFGATDKRQCNIYLDEKEGSKLIFSKCYVVNEKEKFPLSNRELQILEQFSNGLTTGQVAKELFVSENTVKTHRKNILLKLNVRNTTEAVKLSVKNRWLA